MKIQLIRNATMKLNYAGHTFLTDPMLVAKDAFVPFAGLARNPTVELPMSAAKATAEVDCLLVSHLHPDHFDKPASENLIRTLPVFCQPGDEAHIAEEGFASVTPIVESLEWQGVTITRTGGQHGVGEILKLTGEVSGFVLQAAGEPTVYWVGDSIWCDEVARVIQKFSPDVIITHSGAAIIPGHETIIMDGEQTVAVAKAAPAAVVVAVHFESLDHCVLTRAEMREMAGAAGWDTTRLRIPADGEVLSF